MKPEDYSERDVEINGWPVHLTIYRLDRKYHCHADNVSPGACLARVVAGTKDEAESKALARATELLSRVKRHPV